MNDMYLCGGTFLTLLTQYKKNNPKTKKVYANYALLGGLSKMVGYDASDTYKGSSASVSTSGYRGCEDKAPAFLLIEDEVTGNKFHTDVVMAYAKKLIEAEKYVDKYINISKEDPWLVRALLELLDRDSEARPTDCVYALPDGNAITVEELVKESNVYLPSLILGIWDFIIYKKRENTKGRDTFLNWVEQSGTNNEYVLKAAEIGNSIKQPIYLCDSKEEALSLLCSDDEDEDEPEIDFGNVDIDILSGKVAPEITAENADKIFLIDMVSERKGVIQRDSSDTGIEKRLAAYMDSVIRKFKTKKTLFYEQPEPFEDFYVCNNLLRRTHTPQSLIDGSSNIIRNATVLSLQDVSCYLFIVGDGGIGKSMMMQHLMIDASKNYEEYEIIPVLLLLKKYTDITYLDEWACETVNSMGLEIDIEGFRRLLKAGKVTFLLDGMDEIKMNYKLSFEEDLEGFIDKYPACQYIISTRNYENLIGYGQFTVSEIQGFTQEQAIECVKKLRYREDVPEVKEGFIKELEGPLWKTHKDFAENPLLLSIMLMTYERYSVIPDKIHVFYKEAFETLAIKHDATKGAAYNRDMKTGLKSDEFLELLAEFCARSYQKEDYDFESAELIKKYFESLHYVKRNNLKCSYTDFIYDLEANLCLMFDDSDGYHWTHRTFQEYFCAYYFSQQKDKTLWDVSTKIFNARRKKRSSDTAYGMLYEMVPEQIKEYVVLPYLDMLFKRWEDMPEEVEIEQEVNLSMLKDVRYWNFLNDMYVSINSYNGNVTSASTSRPNEFLYRFIISKFGIERDSGDGDIFPRDDEFVAARYGFINTNWGDPNEEKEVWDIVDIDDIDPVYLDTYGEPDEEGCNLEIDIGTLMDSPDEYANYIEIIEADDFPLMVEYKLLLEFRENLRKEIESKEFKSTDDFDIFDLF